MMKLYLASGNAHKLQEIQALLTGLPLDVCSARELGGMPEVDENAPDFHGNARLKARALQVIAPDNAWVLADDSGLAVEALQGAPGVRSARYAGANATDAANNAKLLQALQGRSAHERRATFHCVFCLLGPATEVFFEGSCVGQILEFAQGDAGFGYDPLFRPEGSQLTFAELGDEAKNRISHRARAAQGLHAWLERYLQAMKY